jgi:PAS domain S-box-containing protein
LVVDDDALQAKLARFRLKLHGFDVLTACNGLEALQVARASAPDAIVSDVMMPQLDGFGLCAALRQDAALARIPLVLMSNSYVDEADRQLARAAGADELVIRTPSLQEVVDALRGALSSQATERALVTEDAEQVEKKWTGRVLSQLERQVAINAGMSRRCAMLSAEVAVSSGISDALASDRDIQTALVDVLGACVDAGGFSLGALAVAEPSSLLRFGGWQGWAEAEVQQLLGDAERTHEIQRGEPLVLATPAALRGLCALLSPRGLRSLLVIPVKRGRVTFGTLLMGSTSNTLLPEDRLAFLEGVATQIAQALALSRAFAEKDASERRANAQATVLRSVLDAVADGVVVTDAWGESVLWNPAAEALLGAGGARAAVQKWPERLGLRFGDTLAPVAPEQIPLLQALRGHAVDEHATFLIGDGAAERDRHMTISARPLKEAGAVTGAVAVLRDVSDEKATQTRLLVADRLASVGMLAAGVAHEINNPLAAVIGNIELALTVLEPAASDGPLEAAAAGACSRALSPLVSDDLGTMLREASEAATRVRRIVQDLRALARGEEEASSAVDIHAVIESVLRMANNEIRHRAQIIRDYGAVAPVLGSEPRLCQIFLNLVVNAAQALTDGRADQHEIRIRTRMDELGRVLVTVQDTGEGIAPEHLRQLFVPFFTTKHVGLGTGLGLSICHRLVTAAGGEIRVDSQRGRGSAFHVALRAASGEAAVEPPAQQAQVLAPPLRRGRLLLVDDETMILTILTRALGRDHDCTVAYTGRDALSRISAGERFDLILCDLMMPVMNGMDLYSEICRVAPGQAEKILFLTGGAFTPALQRFLSSVSNERLEKPFDVSEMQALVNARVRAVG